MLNKIICGDCLEVIKDIPNKSVNLILTDPPYPDIEKSFKITKIDFLKKFNCRQLIFWSAKCPFPLDYTAVHIWHKPNGRTGQHYERIFERNGNKVYRVFRHGVINSVVAAQMLGDIYTKHPTQKPIKLIKELIEKYSKKGDTILDPFLGSGTTAVACKQLNRNYIGIEINPKYYEIARQRLRQEVLI